MGVASSVQTRLPSSQSQGCNFVNSTLIGQNWSELRYATISLTVILLVAVERYLKSIDEDGSGVISADQLEDCLRILGFCPTDEDIIFIIKHFDANGE